MGDQAPHAAGLAVFAAAHGLAVTVVVLAFAYAVLAVMAALGLTSFSLLERFRRRRGREPENGGIDDLF